MMGRHEWRAQADAGRRLVRQNAGSSLLEAAVMLLVGFYFLRGITGVSDSAVYNCSVFVVAWTFRIGGLVLLGVALLCWVGWRQVLLVDAIVSGAIGVSFVVTGAIWMVNSDLMGALVVLFGLMSLHSARASWGAHQSVAGIPLGAETVTGTSGGLPESSVPEEPVETLAKGEALKRLLDRKKGVASKASAGGEPVREEERCPGSRREEAAEAPPRVDVSGEPLEGFLAELGRGDEQEGA